MMSSNAKLNEIAKIVTGLACVAPSTSTPDYVSMKGYSRLTIIISAKNGSTVTGSAISLEQATAVANTAGKALAYTQIYASVNTGAAGNNDTLTAATVSSNSYTLDATNTLSNLYVIEINETDLDVANNFDCVRCNTGDSVNQTLSVVYVLWPAKFAGQPPLSAIID